MRAVLIGFAVLGIVAAGVAEVASRAAAAGPHYLTASIKRGKVVKTVTATGTVKAVVTVKVGSQLSGQIDKLFVDFNSTVNRGEPLARLDQSVYRAKLGEAQAALDAAKTSVAVKQAAIERARTALATARAKVAVLNAATARARTTFEAAERDLGRTRALRGRSVVSIRQLDKAETDRDAALDDLHGASAREAVQAQQIGAAAVDLKRAEAELANARAIVMQKQAELGQAQVELDRTIIRSPIDGVVIGRKVDRGQTVAATLKAPTLFTIAQDLRRMEVHARIDEADIGQIRLGQPAAFSVDAFPGRRFSARVVQIRKAPQVVNHVVTYTVVLAAPNPELLLLPGMTALVRIVVREADGVLKLPNSALRFRPASPDRTPATADAAPSASRGTEASVWVLGRDGRPKPVRVRLSLSDAMISAVAGGPLREGERVIIGTMPASDRQGPFGLRLGF